MISVLFIDDDPEVLAGLTRALWRWREDYEFCLTSAPLGHPEVFS